MPSLRLHRRLRPRRPRLPAEQRLRDTATRQELHAFLRALPASRFPALAAHGTDIWADDRDERFNSGLDTLLRGLRAGLGPAAAPSTETSRHVPATGAASH